jgi:hypothetical protein
MNPRHCGAGMRCRPRQRAASSVAEHLTFNQMVVGSNPTRLTPKAVEGEDVT